MVSDSEPRYRIVDSNGNVVGSLYGDAASGEVRLEESTNENEAVLKSDGTWDVPAVNTDQATINETSVRAEATTNTSVSDGSQTIVVLDQTDHIDTDLYSFDDANDEIDINVAGTYEITAKFEWSKNDGLSDNDAIKIYITVNGSNIVRDLKQSSDGTELQGMMVSTEQTLSQGDRIAMVAQQFSGTTVDVTDISSATYLEIQRSG